MTNSSDRGAGDGGGAEPSAPTRVSPTVLAAIIGAVAMIAAAAIGVLPILLNGGRSTAQGEIRAPLEGTTVGESFTVAGTLAGIPENSHVWIAVQVGNLLFPKEPEIPSRDREWSQEVVEAGSPPTQRFSLVLLQVDASAQQTIANWLREGRRRGEFAGLRTNLSGVTRLDVVANLVIARSEPTQSAPGT